MRWRHALKDPNAMDSVPIIAPQPLTWQPDRAAKRPSWPVPSLGTALLRGLRCTCPGCGTTKLFRGYLRVSDDCTNCGAPLGSIRADDAPPYFTIFVVGHIVVPGMFMVNRAFDPPDWVQAAIWLPATLFLCLALLRPIKGATVGLMLHLGLAKAGQDA
jgi:uncharacterized protein (DUF983 family)